MNMQRNRKRIKKGIACILLFIIAGMAVFCVVKELLIKKDTDYMDQTKASNVDLDENVVQSLEEIEEVYYPEGIYVELGGNHKYPIQMFQRDRKCWFLLPSYAVDKEIQIFYNDKEYQLNLCGNDLATGEIISSVIWDQPQSFVIKKDEKNYEYEVIFKHAENLPTVFLNTKSGNMDHILEEKGNEEPGEVAIVMEDGTERYTGSVAKFKGRGNYSWSRNKKSFVMHLENPASLLDMGSARKWILLSNVDDGSYMRNKITFDVARELGIEFVTDAEFIDLYLNGEYAGNYYLCEKIEVAPERIQLQEEGKQNYLIELDNYLGEDSTFISETGVKVSIHYPESATTEQNANIAQIFQSVENSILADDGIDPITGKYYTELIDLDGLTKRYLIDEMGKLDDGWDGSSYYFTRSDGKLYAGPVWDYELSLGNVPPWFGGDENPQGLRQIQISSWYAALYQKEDFYQNMVGIYNTQMVPILNSMLDERIDEYARKIYASTQMDRVIYQGKNFYLPYSSLDGQVKALKSFIRKRMEFLDEIWNQGMIYYEVLAEIEGQGVIAHYYIKDGECVKTLPLIVGDERIFEGWYYQNGQKYSPFYPIFEDTLIIGKWKESNG